MPEALLTRRTLITGSALVGVSLVAAACTSSPSPEPSASESPSVDPDADVRASVGTDEAAIIALYDAAIAAHPALATSLAEIRDEHAAHAEAMGPPVTAPPPPTVGSRAQALQAIIAAEQQAIAQRTAACEAASSGELARVTALIAASEAGHVEFLRGLT